MRLCRRTVSVCLFVRPSVTFVYSVETSKHIFTIFSPSSSHTILVFRTKRNGNIPTGTPNGGVQCRQGKQKSLFDECVAIGSTTVGLRSTDDGRPCSSLWQLAFIVYRTDRHASVNLVYHSQNGLRRTEENRTEFNCMQL